MVVFLVLFAFVTVLGFYASRWRKSAVANIDEWALAGRQFGTFITWFLLGGDLYTAYTFIAVPALAFGAGALAFYAVPYTIVVYPFVFVVLPRFWSVAKAKGYVTAADFVKGRFQSRGLALAVAISGILATLPYIALQMVGMKTILQALGFGGDIPIIVAFAILAAYTYLNGLRAPAMVAVVKDILIYATIIGALIIIPGHLGGFGHIFQAANVKLHAAAKPGSVLLSPKLYTAYATLALGSAVALFFYPHAMTGVLASKSRDTVRKNAAFLPLYSLMLGGIALLGFMALAAHINVNGNNNLAVPLLFLKEFSPWFVGVAFAAILIGALVPASVMAIAASNLFTRNIYREYFVPHASENQQAGIAKFISLLVMLAALIFVVGIPVQFSLYLQTLGGVWILQTVPMIVGGIYTRWFHRTGLLIGWLVGMVLGTWMEYSVGFTTSFFALSPGIVGYAGIWALIANGIVVAILSLILHAAKVSNGVDETTVSDYQEEATSA
ncbi:sodium:solute symporter [Sulfobacillus sp. DSM 109850]|uniref:Sodium:solute symporter n=2 Tax=Sulfobacillus harzensis TaxID=2729629 RepID=A0A7Y0Q250_9FIRM|nr:sodium:solute symporter [Sulfobacillus harzensis]NMP22112.1 sodium:solute symporter [Sulfobacillus harzensis]